MTIIISRVGRLLVPDRIDLLGKLLHLDPRFRNSARRLLYLSLGAYGLFLFFLLPHGPMCFAKSNGQVHRREPGHRSTILIAG